MEKIAYNDLLDAGVHFGHLKKKWNPKMSPYIFAERKGIHIIDLYKTIDKLEEAAGALKSIASSGKKILFVATKKQAKELVADYARRVNMPFVTERWLGGMLTNFATINKSIKKMQNIERMASDGSFENITKKERLMLMREKEKLERVLGGIAQLNRLPAALFVVDIKHEHIAVAEAQKLNINTFGIVDTNSDPTKIDFPVPANDDASKSVNLIMRYLTNAIVEGLEERKVKKAEMDAIAKREHDEREAAALAGKERQKDAESTEKDETKGRRRRKSAATTNESKTEVKTVQKESPKVEPDGGKNKKEN